MLVLEIYFLEFSFVCDIICLNLFKFSFIVQQEESMAPSATRTSSLCSEYKISIPITILEPNYCYKWTINKLGT